MRIVVGFDASEENAVERTQEVGSRLEEFTEDAIEEGSGRDCGWIEFELKAGKTTQEVEASLAGLGYEAAK